MTVITNNSQFGAITMKLRDCIKSTGNSHFTSGDLPNQNQICDKKLTNNTPKCENLKKSWTKLERSDMADPIRMKKAIITLQDEFQIRLLLKKKKPKQTVKSKAAAYIKISDEHNLTYGFLKIRDTK